MRLVLSLALLCLAACSAPSRFQVSEDGGAPRLDRVFDRVHTSVVTIRTVGKSTEADRFGRLASASGVGSGVLISDDGRILTAAHVVQTADKVLVEFPAGERVPARVLSSLPAVDLAMIQLTEPAPASAAIATLGDSDPMRVGAQVFVVGAPLGISHTLTVGHLSARRAKSVSPGGDETVELFQTDASINPGNSGGPMFNLRGEVIGVVSHIVTESGGSAGLGFAVTSNVARKFMLDKHAFWSGMDDVTLSGDLAQAFNLPGGRTGRLIQRVAKDSPADRLGLRGGTIPVELGGQHFLIGGDVMLEVLGHDVGDPGAAPAIRAAVEALRPGDSVSVTVLRAGELMTLEKSFDELRD